MKREKPPENKIKTPAKNQQKQQPIKKGKAIVVIAPKTLQINALKESFISALRSNSGNVSAALKTSGLKRNVAYDHFKLDTAFRDDWLDAQETSVDELFEEARSRAFVEKSDTLLIYLMNQHSANKKWRSRLIQAGNLALEAIQTIGAGHGLAPELIAKMQDQMTESFNQIQLT